MTTVITNCCFGTHTFFDLNTTHTVVQYRKQYSVLCAPNGKRKYRKISSARPCRLSPAGTQGHGLEAREGVLHEHEAVRRVARARASAAAHPESSRWVNMAFTSSDGVSVHHPQADKCRMISAAPASSQQLRRFSAAVDAADLRKRPHG